MPDTPTSIEVNRWIEAQNRTCGANRIRLKQAPMGGSGV
jgi:hypothetical protein